MMKIVAGGGGEDDAVPGGDAHQGDGVAPGDKEHPPIKPQLGIKWYKVDRCLAIRISEYRPYAGPN